MELYKHHSYAACIGEGFSFLAKNLFLITKVMLPYYTVSALFIVLFLSINTKLSVDYQAYGDIAVDEYLIALFLFLLTFITSTIATGRLYLMFRRLTGSEIKLQDTAEAQTTPSWKLTAKRTMQLSWLATPYIIWQYLFNIPGIRLSTYLGDFIQGLTPEFKILAIIILLSLLIIAVIAAAPLVYTFFCRMMRPSIIDTTTEEGKQQSASFTLKAAYKKAFSHKGKIISVSLLSCFIVGIASLVLLLPGIVAIQAYFSSVEGSVNFGDTVLIPTSGYALMIIVSTLALTLVQLFAVSMHATLLYLYGDIYSNT